MEQSSVTMRSAETLTIGRAAAAADVTIQTLRYYERRGLLTPPRRSASGYRHYDHESLRRLRFIKQAQRLGFSLREIRELLNLRARNADACTAVGRKTREKVEVVRQRIRELQGLQRALERLAAACASRSPTDECPILEALEDDAVSSK